MLHQYHAIAVNSTIFSYVDAYYMQEFGGYAEIRLSELQPDGRFIVDVNDTTGQVNRKCAYAL